MVPLLRIAKYSDDTGRHGTVSTVPGSPKSRHFLAHLGTPPEAAKRAGRSLYYDYADISRGQ